MLLRDRYAQFRSFGADIDIAEILKYAEQAVDLVSEVVEIGQKIDSGGKKSSGSSPAVPTTPPHQNQTQPATSQPQTPGGGNVKGLGSSIDTNTVLMAGGGIAALGILAFVFTRKKR